MSGEQLHQDPLTMTQVFGRDREEKGPIMHSEMRDLIDAINRKFDAGAQVMQSHGETLQRIDTALFYKPTDENDDTPPGIVPVMRKIDKHVDVMCSFAQFVGRALSWGVPIACGLVGLVGQFKGWW